MFLLLFSFVFNVLINCMKSIIKLLNYSNIQPIVLVGYLSNFAEFMKKLGFLNTLLKCNLFIYRGFTVLLKPVDPKENASPPGPRKSHSWLGFQRKHEISIILAISVFSKDLDQDKQILKQKQSLCFYPLLESVAKFSIVDLVMLVDYWRSDVNKNKEGETGRSECEVTKTRYLEAEELREIWDLGWKSSFQNKLGPAVCIILILVLRRSLLTSVPFSFTFFFFF